MNELSGEYEAPPIRPDLLAPPAMAPATAPVEIQNVPEELQSINQQNVSTRSWVFRGIDFVGWAFSKLFGIASVVFLLAVTANIPILQFLSFGYLLEVTGRVARHRRLRSAFIGLDKASKIGSAILGAWLCLIPVRFVSQLVHEAQLIDPASRQTQFMRMVLLALMALSVGHIIAAWYCGGKLKHFFWPIVAPFSFAIWFSRKFAGSVLFRTFLRYTVGLLSPKLVEDVCNAQPVSDWFLPAIAWKKFRAGRSIRRSRDAVWEFFAELNLGYYFNLGLKGFMGTALWLVVPTWLLVISTSLKNEAGAFLVSLLGAMIAIPVFSILPFVQAHFAVDGRLRSFLEVRKVLKNVGSAPFVHILALFLTLLFAVPLFLTKIEEIPTELLWSLSIIFVIFTWPAKVAIGWAYSFGARRGKQRRWWIRYPIFALAVPICFSFTFILFFTRYITWNGALSLVENHVFLLPAPFWLSFFTG